jgi:thiol-disulfide isomerase/thioredoxin
MWHMHQVVLFARLALCAVFAVAALRKLSDRGSVANGITQFGVSVRVAPFATAMLIVSELAVAAALGFDRSVAVGALGAVALLVAFTAVVGSQLVRGRRPACNCFGAAQERPIGWDTVARNVVFIGLAGFVAAFGAEAPVFATLSAIVAFAATQPALVAVGAVAIAMLAIVAFVLWQVLQQQGRILLRLETLERVDVVEPEHPVAPARQGLAIGSAVPSFALETMEGATENLEALGAQERPVLLVFVNPKCGPCHALLPEIARWQRDYSASLTVVLVSEGSAADNREKTVAGLERVLLQREREVSNAFEAYGTPSAVLIEDGRIASSVAAGADAIRALVSEFLDGHRPPAIAVGDTLPELLLETASGGDVSLRDAVTRASAGAVLLFWNPQCGFCANMLPDLREWGRDSEEGDAAPKLVVISSRPLGDEATGLEATILIDAQSRTAAAFGAGGTPMAVLVDSGGVVASKVVAGRDGVLELLNLEPVHG